METLSRRSIGRDNKNSMDQKSYINLKVHSQVSESEVIFTMKSNKSFKKLMYTYCKMQSLHLKSTTFLFDGRKLKPLQTPEELGMEDGDEIDAFQMQDGGGPK